MSVSDQYEPEDLLVCLGIQPQYARATLALRQKDEPLPALVERLEREKLSISRLGFASLNRGVNAALLACACISDLAGRDPSEIECRRSMAGGLLLA